ncbi:MAG: M3 family oligoendopeptidase [Phycisphaeraceae bacterium]|nr:M3 family oligoendopeptidase [Phycisphaeraceae bacterium]
MTPVATTTGFVPADLDANRWDQLEPLYADLQQRPLRCEGCLERLLLDRSELDAAAAEAHANLYIAMTCNTEDQAARTAYLAFVEGIAPNLRRVGFELDRRIVESPHRGRLDQDRYGVLLRNLDADVALFRSENIPLHTQDTKLGQKYAEVAGGMTIDWEGEERTLPQAMKLLEETDRGIRERAWRLVAERRFRDHERLNGILDEMIALRTKIAANAGHPTYREWSFASKHRFDYTPADCERFHRTAERVCVPLFRRINAERARLLGVNRLRPWDLAVDIHGRAPLRPFATADELVEKTSRLFHAMDASLGQMFDTLRDGTSLDLESRRGKAPGGYQENRDRSRRPFIFMNAAGTQPDLETMIHEAGHAFHALLTAEEPLLAYRHAPIEFCEVASMGMELLAHPYLDIFHDEESAARARRSHLEQILRMIPWTAQVDAFQHWLYTHPRHTHDERAVAWLELDTRLGPSLDWSGLEMMRRVGWQRQLHIFEVPFYYIEYGIAQLGALQLWMIAQRDPAGALDRYRGALSLGGSRPLPELFAAAGLTFDFGEDTVRRLMDAIEQELEKCPA